MYVKINNRNRRDEGMRSKSGEIGEAGEPGESTRRERERGEVRSKKVSRM